MLNSSVLDLVFKADIYTGIDFVKANNDTGFFKPIPCAKIYIENLNLAVFPG